MWAACASCVCATKGIRFLGEVNIRGDPRRDVVEDSTERQMLMCAWRVLVCGFGQLRAGAHGSPRASQLVQHGCSGLRSEQPHYARAVSLIRTRPRTTGGDWSPICIRSRKQSGTELGVRADEDVTDRNSTTGPCGAMPTKARPSPSAACWRSRRTQACLLVDAGWPPQSVAG